MLQCSVGALLPHLTQKDYQIVLLGDALLAEQALHTPLAGLLQANKVSWLFRDQKKTPKLGRDLYSKLS